MVAVIDRSQEDGTIVPTNWRKVERALSANFLKIMKENPGSIPICQDGGWHRNYVKLISCADQRSLFLYTKAIESLGEVWPGAKLEVINREDIPSRPRARAWIPAEPNNPVEIMEMFQMSNPNLPTANWKIVKLDEPKNDYRSAIIILNRESVDILAKTNGVARFGFVTVTLKVYKKDEADGSVTAVPDGLRNIEQNKGITEVSSVDSEMSKSMETFRGLVMDSDSGSSEGAGSDSTVAEKVLQDD